MNYVTDILSSDHNRKAFSCGKTLLDNYLRFQAGQDIKRKLSVCFVLTDKSTHQIKGYYTLSNSSVSLNNIPDKLKKKLPKSYTFIPVTLLGRLAVDARYQGQGIGELLLIDALKRSSDVAEVIGSFAVIVDPLDNEAERFYHRYGFIKLPDSGKMFLPMKSITRLFKR